MRYKVELASFLLLCLDFLALLYGVSTLSISEDEAKIFFSDEKTALWYLLQSFVYLFGQNDLALRTPILLLHFLSCILLFILALKLTKNKKDAFFSLLLFVLLPGTVASALIVNEASLVIFISLLILCAYEYKRKILFYIFFILALFIDKSFLILFLGFFFFSLYKKDYLLFWLSLLLFSLSFSFYGFDTSGRPYGFFLDTLGIFAACFSPLVFVYFFYVIYRLFLKEDKPLLWFIMSVTFIFCSLLSIRQKVYLDDFLPFCVISTPLLVSTFMSSYRVRLPKFRLKYNVLIQCAFIFLLLFYLVLIFNPLLYSYLKNPSRHFAYNYHGAKELALELKKHGIYAIKTNKAMQLRLKFYGISSNSKLLLQKSTKRGDIVLSFGPLKEYYRIKYP